MSRLDTKHITLKRFLQVAFLLSIIVIVTFIIHARYRDTLDKTAKELASKVISYNIEGFENFSKKATSLAGENFVQKVSSDDALRRELEDMLQLMRTSTIQNLFVIFQDTDKGYSFLLDSETDPSNHAEMFQPFEPASEVWDNSYKTASLQRYEHQKNRNLWITIAVPLIENNTTVALLGADISFVLDEEMQVQLENFGELFLLVFLLSASWFTLLYILILYFRRKYHEGYIDPLTEIYNRRYLYDVLLKKLGKKYQLIMIDIDHFKEVNDTYGHNIGDEVLKEVAQNIKKMIRPKDIFIRHGGEEFLLYTLGLDEQQSMAFAQRLCDNIASTHITYDNITCTVSISLGVNPYASSSEDFNKMLHFADEALYEAKTSGRNRVCLSEKP